ncbi:MAG: alpha/beta fold hydrolase [bacterium]|nr:alpha/beta fold hydrolase [bacterium]
MTSKSDYWRQYHDEATITRSDNLRTTHQLSSTGVNIHIDMYEQPSLDAPVIIFNHGGGGYSRLFIPVALAMYDLGYTVLLPDQRGQGFSEGDRGDFTYSQFIQNVVDVANWARNRYSGKLFMGGGSVGGGITYAAGVAGAPVDALVCHNLYSFGSVQDGMALSRLASLTKIPFFSTISLWSIKLSASLMPRLKIPFMWLGKFEKMVDERATGFFELWKADPLPIKRVSLRYLHSSMTTPPLVPFEQNTLPILVINQTRDRMVSPSVTRRNYDRLSGHKEYVEIDYGHWAMGETFVSEWSGIVHHFLSQF